MDATGLKEKEGTPSHMPGSAPMQTRPASQASTVASVQHGSLSPLQFADGSAPQRFTVSVSRCWLECHSCVATKCMCNAGAHTRSRATTESRGTRGGGAHQERHKCQRRSRGPCRTCCQHSRAVPRRRRLQTTRTCQTAALVNCGQQRTGKGRKAHPRTWRS